MPLLNRMSIQSKLMLMLLSVSILSILVIAILAYRNGSNALTTAVLNQLTAARASKARQIESYLADRHSQALILSRDLVTINTMKALKAGFYYLEERSTATGEDALPDFSAEVTTYYREQVLPEMTAYGLDAATITILVPGSAAGRYLQHYYTTPSADDEAKLAVDNAGDGSSYSAVHARYHSLLRTLVTRFGYEDLFLVDHISGDVVYTAYKGIDFGVNLYRGPYANGPLAHVVERAANASLNETVFQDFGPYQPNYGAPQAFVASPIYEGATMIGVLVLQLSRDAINAVMTGNNNWPRDGLGTTGEVYLIGPDFRMRSDSRFHLQDPAAYLTLLPTLGTPSETIDAIRIQGTTVLQQEIRTDQAVAALDGKAGTLLALDYRDQPVLASYAPLDLPGLRWAIIAEMDQVEAFAANANFTRIVLISTVLLILVVTLLSMWLSNIFVRPLHALNHSAQLIAGGNLDARVPITTHDEFGALASAFNEMAESVREKSELVEKKNREYEDLLLNLLPAPVVERFKSGEEQIADAFPNVTVLYADLGGFVGLADKVGPAQSLTVLNDLVNSFDEAATRYNVDKIKTVGSAYLAVSGLVTPLLDHASRVLQLAMEMVRIVHLYNQDHEIHLTLHVGVNSGPIAAGVVGRDKFVYDLWGDTVSVAVRIGTENKATGASRTDSIWVTQTVRDRMAQSFDFAVNPSVITRSRGEIPTWTLTGEVDA